MPAFFGDGYGVIRRLFEADFYADGPRPVIALLAVPLRGEDRRDVPDARQRRQRRDHRAVAVPGRNGGRRCSAWCCSDRRLFAAAQPEVYALVGMGAVLAAVVHAPLASILILSDLTHDYAIILPAMLATVIATGVARMIFRDSIYTLTLRARRARRGAPTVACSAGSPSSR